MTLSAPDAGSTRDRLDETLEYRLRCAVLADQGVRNRLWELAAERPDTYVIPSTAEEAGDYGRRVLGYQKRLADTARWSDGHLTVGQLDRIVERLRDRHPSCVTGAPVGLPAGELTVLFALPPSSEGWPSGKPDLQRRRGEGVGREFDTVRLVACSIALRMAGCVDTWVKADALAGKNSDWTTRGVSANAICKYRQRLRRRLPQPPADR
jgi:hypothetical protein